MIDGAVAERGTWHTRIRIDEYPVDKLEWAHGRALAAGLWLPPDGDNDAPVSAWPKIPATPRSLAQFGVLPDESREYEHNVLCTAGITRLLNLLIGAGGQAYDATHTRVLVGDGGGSAPTGTAADTDLTAIVNAANRYGQLVSGANTVSTNVLTIAATFATGNGNFHWFEFAFDQAAASGATAATAPLLNHKGLDMGTKSSSIAWAFTGTVTIT